MRWPPHPTEWKQKRERESPLTPSCVMLGSPFFPLTSMSHSTYYMGPSSDCVTVVQSDGHNLVKNVSW